MLMQPDKHEGPAEKSQSQPKQKLFAWAKLLLYSQKQELNCCYTVKNTIEVCVPRYFKVGLLLLGKVNIPSSIHVNMSLIPNILMADWLLS